MSPSRRERSARPGYVPGTPRLGIPALQETDAELGVANPGNIRRGDTATAMPSNLAMASSFDVDLARRQGEAVGAEARAKGFNVVLGGASDLIRDPRGGRNFEYVSEDPLLTGMIAGAEIAGVQSRGLISTMKHYALNAQETDRVALDARIDRAAMREADLFAFEIAIEQGRPGSVMCAYNQVNSHYSCENDWLLNQVLKGDWRYPGFVMSDWGAVHSTVPAVLAGLDQELGEQLDTQNFLDRPLAAAIADGAVPQSRLDDMVRRILTSIFAAGLYDHPPAPDPVDLGPSDAVALQIEREGAVLLKNDGLLPLDAKVRRVAVIGAHAQCCVLSGGGSSQVVPRGGPALKEPARLAGEALLFDPSSPLEALRKQFPSSQFTYCERRDLACARRAAGEADVAVVFAQQWAREGADVADLALPDDQDQLIFEIARANARTLVVLETDGPVLMPWLERVGAVLEAWYPGQQGGEAIAEIIAGAVNPSGRLPVTFPRSASQLPHPEIQGDPNGAPKGPVGRGGRYDRSYAADYFEGAEVGYKWFAAKGESALFPLGFGLSYASFALDGLSVSNQDGKVVASVEVRNAGRREGVATPQFYVRGTGAGAPFLRLAGWSRVALKPGERRRVDVAVDPRLLASFDEEGRCWRIAGGSYRVEAGFDAQRRDLAAAFSVSAAQLPP